jgi:hypothetical protein
VERGGSVEELIEKKAGENGWEAGDEGGQRDITGTTGQ